MGVYRRGLSQSYLAFIICWCSVWLLLLRPAITISTSTLPPSPAPSFSPETSRPSTNPSDAPSASPETSKPSESPITSKPSRMPSHSPSTSEPSKTPSHSPATSKPSRTPSHSPSTSEPSKTPSHSPSTSKPSRTPSHGPSTSEPSKTPSHSPATSKPSRIPSSSPSTSNPSHSPTTAKPSRTPSSSPSTSKPSQSPTTAKPSRAPSSSPSTSKPSQSPSTTKPSRAPSTSPSTTQSQTPSMSPTHSPITSKPSRSPTFFPSVSPTSSAPSRSPSTTPTTSAPSQTPTTSRPSHAPSLAPSISPSMPTGSPTYAHKPNVLMVISDDLKPLLSSFNSPYTDSDPNVSFLAKNGIRFMNAQSQFSLCGPSRASFMTSLRPDTLNIYSLQPGILSSRIAASGRKGRKPIDTLPGWLKKNGYSTYGAGKVFHENEYNLYVDPNTWTEPVYTWMNQVRPPSFVTPYQGAWVDFPAVSDEYFSDGQMADLAVSIITDKLSQNEPWFFAVGFYKPHLPFQAPQKYYNLSQNDPPVSAQPQYIVNVQTTWFQIARGDQCQEVSAFSGDPAGIISSQSPLSIQQSAARGYRAAVAYMDAQLGKLISALITSNQLNDTLIVFMGEHGFHLGDKGKYCKHDNWEHGVRTPLIIMPPLRERQWNAQRGKASYAPVELIDVLPTIADLLGIPSKYGPGSGNYPWQGMSLRPILQNPDSGYVKPFAMSQYPRQWGSRNYWGYTIRTTRYRYTLWMANKKLLFSQAVFAELYDFISDPHETTNWATVSSYAGVKSQIASVWTNRGGPPNGIMPFDFSDRTTLATMPLTPFP